MVRNTVEYFFGEIKTYKSVDFTSQLKIGLSSVKRKIGLSSVERIYLIYGITKTCVYAKICVYGNKADDVFETNPITVIFCYCPEMKISGTLNKHPGFQQRCKMIHK